MDYHALVEDFANRTRSNLLALRRLQESGVEIFEVTALVNSMLGLLVFPQQSYVDALPEVPLDELEREGWPIPRLDGNYPQAKNLKQLVRYLRNAVAHFNMKFNAGSDGQIAGLTIWNTDPRSHAVTWRASLTVEQLERIAMQFVALLLNESALAKRYPVARP
ncbi:HEPN family nuclease [Variovorax sp. HJSM1_2]|uniref:HEPN family nuclease n=1 Tax=Variovorax sp. HJSM1_2 TaxID=3366263 RepID=UPI003BC97EC3